MRETFIKTVPYSEDFASFNKSGWGCGYVYIPKEHPILIHLILNKNDYYYYLQPENCDQEITLSQWEKDLDYYIIGFDTAHIYNNASHDKAYVEEEANKIKKLIDSFTAENARNLALKQLELTNNELINYL